jgi:hypothetical protein
MVDTVEKNKPDFVFDLVNGIGKVIAYPGELFKMNVFYGVAFMGVLGTVIAIAFMAIGYK